MMKIRNSYIFLNGLRFHAFHGVMPQERLTGNDYRIDLKINYPLDDAVVTDELEDTLNIKVAKCNPPMGADTADAGVELHIINEKTE